LTSQQLKGLVMSAFAKHPDRIRRGSPPPPIVRFKKPRRLKDWCAFTGTSKATTWRRIKDGTLLIAYLGAIPYIIGGPAGLSGDSDDVA
jgi:hypothetical protein